MPLLGQDTPDIMLAVKIDGTVWHFHPSEDGTEWVTTTNNVGYRPLQYTAGAAWTIEALINEVLRPAMEKIWQPKYDMLKENGYSEPLMVTTYQRAGEYWICLEIPTDYPASISLATRFPPMAFTHIADKNQKIFQVEIRAVEPAPNDSE